MAPLARALGAIVLIALNLRTVLASLGSAATAIEETLDGGGALVGAASSLSTLLLAVGAPVCIWLVRRYEVDTVIRAALVTTCAALGLLSLASPASIWAAVVLGGLAAGVLGSLLPALVRSLMPGHVGLGIGVMIGATSAGLALASVLVGISVGLWGSWTPATVLLTVLAGVAVLAARGYQVERGQAEDAGAAGARDALRIGWVRALVVFLGIQSFVLFAQIAWLVPTAASSGSSPAAASTALALFSGLQVVTGVTAPLLARRLGRLAVPVLIGSCSSLTGSVLILAMVHGYLGTSATAPAVVLLALGHGASFALANFAIADLSGSAHEAALIGGAVMLVSQAIGALGPVTVGFVRDVGSGYTAPWALLAALGVAQVLAAARLAVTSRRPSVGRVRAGSSPDQVAPATR